MLYASMHTVHVHVLTPAGHESDDANTLLVDIKHRIATCELNMYHNHPEIRVLWVSKLHIKIV